MDTTHLVEVRGIIGCVVGQVGLQRIFAGVEVLDGYVVHPRLVSSVRLLALLVTLRDVLLCGREVVQSGTDTQAYTSQGPAISIGPLD